MDATIIHMPKSTKNEEKAPRARDQANRRYRPRDVVNEAEWARNGGEVHGAPTRRAWKPVGTPVQGSTIGRIVSHRVQTLALCRSAIPSRQPWLRWVAASLDQIAAIHVKAHAGAVTRRRRDQVKHRSRHLLGLGHAPHGHMVQRLVEDLGVADQRPGELGVG